MISSFFISMLIITYTVIEVKRKKKKYVKDNEKKKGRKKERKKKKGTSRGFWKRFNSLKYSRPGQDNSYDRHTKP